MKEKILLALKDIEEVQEMKKQVNDIIKNINKNINFELDHNYKSKEIKKQQKKLYTEIMSDKSDIKLFNNKTIRNIGTMAKNNKFPNLNNFTNSLNKDKTDIKAFLFIHQSSKK